MLLVAKYLTFWILLIFCNSVWKFNIEYIPHLKVTIWIYILVEYDIMVENNVLTKFRNLWNMLEVILVFMLLIIVSNKLWYSTNQSRNCCWKNLQIFLHGVTEQQNCDKTDVGLKKKNLPSGWQYARSHFPSHHQSHF